MMKTLSRHKRLDLLRIFAVALVTIGLCGCGESGVDDPPPPPPPTGFTISGPGVQKDTVTLEVGQQLQFVDQDGLIWSVTATPPDAAIIDQSGLLKAVKVGKAIVVATNSQGTRSTNEVTVNIIAARQPTGLEAEAIPASVEAGPNGTTKGLSGTAKAYALYSTEPRRVDVSSRVVGWDKGGPNADKIEITPNGIFTANGFEGTPGGVVHLLHISPRFETADELTKFPTNAPMAVISNRGFPLQRLDITGAGVQAGTPKTLMVNTSSVDLGLTAQFNGISTPNFDGEAIWKSSASDVAEVDAIGVVTVKKKGAKATITAERLSEPGGELISDTVELTIAP